MEKIYYTNNKDQTIEIGSQFPFLLQNISGVGGSNVDVQTQKAPFQDGTTHIDSLLEMREIQIEVFIKTNSIEELQEKRRELTSVFNPKLEGKIVAELADEQREITAYVDNGPIFMLGRENQGPDYQRVTISLLCPSPFWLSTVTESEEMAAILGGLEYPLEFDPDMTFEEAGDVVEVVNNGDVSTPVKIEFNGPALNPRVENLTTNEYIKVSRELLSGDKLLIDTAFGNKKVILLHDDGSEENAFHWLDLNSVFWNLEVGENIISYSADTGEEDAVVNITWKERFVGV